jgi:membrane-associated protein
MEAFLDFISGNENIWGFLALLFGAGIEYVMPPFPGDTIVLLAGVLVAARGWSITFVLTSVTLGSVLGAMVDYAAGYWILNNPQSRIARWLNKPKRRKNIDRALASMRRYGPAYLTINRFLPGIRAFFFVGAGMARLNPWLVALWGGISALLWNVLILIMGWLLGGNLEALQSLFESYTAVMWGLILMLAVLWMLRAYLLKHRKRKKYKQASLSPPDIPEALEHPESRKQDAPPAAANTDASSGGDEVSR